MPHIYIPATHADDWAKFLAEPVKHWRTGFSAKTLAHSWQEAMGFPAEVRKALQTCPTFADIELLLALPEHQVHLVGGSRPSQNDVWALAKARGGLVSIAVEGKVAEPFGPTIDEWREDESKGKIARLAFLCGELGLSDQPQGSIRYQLLHRTASAVIEAKRFTAKHALMLVHSFSPDRQWFNDYAAFVALYECEAEPETVISVGERGGVQLHLAWVSGDPRYLAR